MDDTVSPLDAVNAPDVSTRMGWLLGQPGRWRGSIGGLVIVVAAACAVVVVGRDSTPYAYLVPWIVLSAAVLVGIVLTIPGDRRDDVLDPVVFAIATYFAPFAVVGAMLLAGGWAEPYYTVLIADPRHNLPLAQLYLMVGIVAVTIGSRLGVASRIGRSLDRRVPSIELVAGRIALGVVVAHVIGLGATLWSFRSGFLGYQDVAVAASSAVPAYLATIMIPARIAMGMMWVLEAAPRRVSIRVAAGVSIASVPIEMALGASRATVVIAAMSIGFGALAAGWRPRLGRLVVAVAVGAIAVAVSVVFATTFRELKNPEGVERTVAVNEQLRLAIDSAGQTIVRGPRIVPDALDIAADRLETTGKVAVVVSQYRSLRDEERKAGIDNSVVDAITAGAVPRLIWPGKPNPPDPRTLSAIYFQFEGNSFATTPMTDLLRNFGPAGVVAGMIALGVGLGIIGAFRRRRGHSIATNMVVGAVLIRGVSYEGLYGAIVSDSVRVGLVAVTAALALRTLSGRPEPTHQLAGDEAKATRAAVVSIDLAQRGGHQGVATYLQDCLEDVGWDVTLISLATSSTDRNSMRLRSPRSWRAPTASDESFDGRPYRHVGAWCAEIPGFRARPRAALDRELDDHDIIVLGVGPSFWTLTVPTDRRDRTVVEFVTRYEDEIVSVLESATGWRRAFWYAQRHIVALQERRALETVAASVVPSNELATWATSSGARDVAVIPLAISDRFGPAENSDVGPGIVAVGRWVDPRKNVTLLLESYARSVAANNAVGSLTLIGTLPSPEVLAVCENVIEDFRDRVRFAGEVTPSDLVAALQRARMIVLASDQEGFGLPIAEAMACGCPAVATRSGGSELTVIDGVNGLLVPRRDAAALATAITTLASDDELWSTLRRGSLVEAEKYRISTVAPQLERVVQRVIDRASQDASSTSRAASTDA